MAVLRQEGCRAVLGAGVPTALDHYRAGREAEVTESLGAAGIGRY